MRIMIATEGESEVRVLPEIVCAVRPEVICKKVLKVTCQPDGTPKHIANAACSLLYIAESKDVDKFVLVLDREDNQREAGTIARDVKQAIMALRSWPFEVSVVLKDRTLENWLIADLDALRKQRARFRVTDAVARQVEPDKADRVRAIEVLKRVTLGRGYDKKIDGLNIAKRLDVDAAGMHSRSFRHFLHVLGHETYSEQCRRPAL